MKAMRLEKPRQIEKEPLTEIEIDKPDIKTKVVLIKVQVCGVCHTDLHTVEGDLDLPRLPIIPGNQIVGIVEKTGDNVENFTP